MFWIALITSLPTENATARMRAWRALKASGAAVLRDGVYLLPERDVCRSALESVAADVVGSGGTALVMRVEQPDTADFVALFDRSAEYAALLQDTAAARLALSAERMADTLKQARKLRKVFASLSDTDFFAAEAQRQADAALQELERALARVLSPDEPRTVHGDIARLRVDDYQGKTWATRRRPWVDRLACAWFIRRYIDSRATVLWLASATDCPVGVLGFDFDGATFSHIGARVSFEVLMASFGLESTALRRLGTLVHFLDIGGVQPGEAAGIESVLAGLRETILDDDQLLLAASAIFDGLLHSFSRELDNKIKI